MVDYEKAFKAYDIRWIYGKEINKTFAYLLGKAIWSYLLSSFETPSFLLGGDVRNQNEEIISYFLWGMQEQGEIQITIADFLPQEDSENYPYGICSTSSLYFLWQHDFDLAVSITASHNPGEFVGMKFFDREVELLSTDFLKAIFYQQETPENLPEFPVYLQTTSGILPQKKEQLFTFLNQKWSQLTKAYIFCIDFSNGAGVTVEKEFFDQLPHHDISYINDIPDGTFSAHESDTSTSSNYQQLIQKVQESWSDFWIMFDGDSDRVWVITASGKIFGGDIITAIIAKQLLEWGGTGDILYDVMSTKTIEDMAKKYGGTSKRTRMWRYFINKELNQTGALFAGEVSGHYMFKEIGGYEMPLLAIYYLLCELEHHESMDIMLQSFQYLYKTPITSLTVSDKTTIMSAIQKIFQEYPQDTLDGVSVYGNNFWMNIRGSNTESKIRYTIEASSEEKLNEIQQQLSALL